MVLFSFGFLISTCMAFAVEYPVRSLGNCANQHECHKYCEIPENKPACWAWKVYAKNDVLGYKSQEITLQELNIAFPIPVLNNCPNLLSCKEFCHNPKNISACQKFFQDHNQELIRQILIKAGEDLKCGSWEDCRNFCNEESNQQICRSFIQKYQLKNSIIDQIIARAGKDLGCATLFECRNYCLIEANRAKCQNFAQKSASLFLNKNQTVLGCQTNSECQKECRKNPKICPNYPVNDLNKPVAVSPSPPTSNLPNPSSTP